MDSTSIIQDRWTWVGRVGICTRYIVQTILQRERVQWPNYILYVIHAHSNSSNFHRSCYSTTSAFLLFFFELTETVLFPVIHGITYSFNMTSNDFTRKSRSITITCVLQNFKFKNIVGLNLKTKFQHGPGIKNGLYLFFTTTTQLNDAGWRQKLGKSFPFLIF